MERHVYARMAAHEDRHWWFVARREILSDLLRRFVALPRSARLLEVGCGTGGNLAMLSGFGRVAALEPDPQARRLASDKGDFDVRAGRLPDGIPFQPCSFDLIAALDVVEHIGDDRATLAALHDLLRPGGWMVITVPAFSFLWSQHDVQHHHRRRYNKAELLRLIEGAGLAPIRVSYFNAVLFPLVAAIRLVRNALGLTGGHDDALPPDPVNSALRRLFAGERHLLARACLPFGTSLLMLARRPAP